MSVPDPTRMRAWPLSDAEFNMSELNQAGTTHTGRHRVGMTNRKPDCQLQPGAEFTP